MDEMIVRSKFMKQLISRLVSKKLKKKGYTTEIIIEECDAKIEDDVCINLKACIRMPKNELLKFMLKEES